MIEIEAELAICEAATPGPWQEDAGGIQAWDEEHDWFHARGPIIKGRPYAEAKQMALRDAAFMCRAREHYPALLRAHQRLRELIGDVCRVSAHRQSSKDIIHLDDDGISEIRTILGMEGKSRD